MHPVFQSWQRLLLYASVWIEIGIIAGLIASRSESVPALEGIALILPLSLFLGFVCLSPLYICRTYPLRSFQGWRLVARCLGATVVASAIVMLAGKAATIVLSQFWVEPDRLFTAMTPLITLLVALIFSLSIAVHYAYLEVESSRRIELLARDAQMKALKAQVNPHFLFNSLNSISALTSLDPDRARQMCIGLADFLRASLRLGEKLTVPFSEELALTNMYLEVEQARFAERLKLVRDIGPECLACEIPALLIQPLVENAVKHGIAMMAEGGEIRLSGGRDHDTFWFSIWNPYDPAAPSQARNGIGLRNVRERLEARYGSAAKLLIETTESTYEVVVILPVRAL